LYGGDDPADDRQMLRRQRRLYVWLILFVVAVLASITVHAWTFTATYGTGALTSVALAIFVSAVVTADSIQMWRS
jgi:hypothetical protein